MGEAVDARDNERVAAVDPSQGVPLLTGQEFCGRCGTPYD